MVDHGFEGDGEGGGVAEDGHGEGVADEKQVEVGFIEDLGDRVVPGGEGGDGTLLLFPLTEMLGGDGHGCNF